MNLIVDQSFKSQNYTKIRLTRGEYENCLFENCDFSNGYLDNQNFLECEFIDCNLSNTNIKSAIFNDVLFSFCKMIGLKFEDLNDLMVSFTFQDCILNLSSFYKMNLKNLQFENCKLHATDFSEADLRNAIFKNCDLQNSIFENSVLEKVDFTTAYNLYIDPEKNRLKKAKFSKDNVLGLLRKYDIVVF